MANDNGGIIGQLNVPTVNLATGVWSIDSQYQAQKSGTWPLGYPLTTIDNSLRFNSGSSDSLTKTTTTPDNRDKLTLSAWFKISSSSTSQEIFGFYGSNDYFTIRASNSNRIDVILYDGSAISRLITTQLLRDFSAWYHIVVVVDSANATADDRVKIYLNGNQITSFSTRINPSQNQDFILSTLTTTGIGINTDQVGGVSRFNGYISEAIYIDNQALDPTSFGAIYPSGIWGPKAYAGTYGTAGFYLDFSNSAALGTDYSGNGNDFTVNNLTSIDQTTDTPTNNFATLNTLNVPTSNAPTFSEGNLKTVTNGVDGNFGGTSTIGISQGKWYAEFKFISTTAGMLVGVTGDPSNDARLNNYTGENILGYSVYSANGNKYNNASNSAFGVSWTTNDIIGVALDLDNHKIYFHKNGVYMNSGDPTSGATGTGSAFNLTTGYDYFFSVSDGSSGASSTIDANFGNAPFTISSGNSDANGYGNFEYAVPSGYYALMH
jgi:hypothetical protein